jgi:hypothetical protein
MFEITQNHLTLLKNMHVVWDDCETGAPAIDPKRPYGNSAVEEDIHEILGWKFKEELTPEQHAKANNIHIDMEIVLQIVLCNYPEIITPGFYKKIDAYNTLSWKRVNG